MQTGREGRGGKDGPTGGGPTGAAVAGTDAESGTDGLAPEEDAKKALFALRAMRERGLIDEETYSARVQALTSGKPGAD